MWSIKDARNRNCSATRINHSLWFEELCHRQLWVTEEMYVHFGRSSVILYFAIGELLMLFTVFVVVLVFVGLLLLLLWSFWLVLFFFWRRNHGVPINFNRFIYVSSFIFFIFLTKPIHARMFYMFSRTYTLGLKQTSSTDIMPFLEQRLLNV